MLGYLIHMEGVHVVLGTAEWGVSRKLRRFADDVEIDVVVISHLHADHFLDLVPLLRVHAPRQQPVAVGGWPGHRRPGAARADAPDAPRRVPARGRAVGQRGPGGDRVRAARVPPRPRAEVGPLRVRFQEVPRFRRGRTPSSSPRMRRPVDLRRRPQPPPTMPSLCHSRDMPIEDAAAAEREGPRGDPTPGEAGEHGRCAQARRLVLTHISASTQTGRAEASGSSAGPVQLERGAASQMLTFAPTRR